jgi:hypothetical protein
VDICDYSCSPSLAPQSKFFLPAGNDALGGAALGLGVGVVGSLLVGALLENHGGCRGKRAEPSAR